MKGNPAWYIQWQRLDVTDKFTWTFLLLESIDCYDVHKKALHGHLVISTFLISVSISI